METYISKIQKDLRSGFPDFSQDSITEVQVHLPGPGKPAEVVSSTSPRWHFKDLQATSGYAVTPNSVMFQTTAYEDSDHFVKALIYGLEIVHAHVDLSYLETVAIRVLDAVIPAKGEDLSVYLEPGALGLRNVLGDTLVQSITQAIFETSVGRMTTRSIIIKGKIGMPADLAPASLRLNERVAAVDQLHVVLDNDCQKNERSLVDFEDVERRIRAVKAQAKQAFEKSVTPTAIKIWS